MFDTSGLIDYFGEDPKMKEIFQDLKGKVVKYPTDHQDLIVTLHSILEQAGGKRLPSNRNGVDLLELTRNLTNKLEPAKHFSIRYTDVYSEYFNDKLYRFSSLLNVGEVFEPLYPTCVSGEKREKTSDAIFNEFHTIRRLFEQTQKYNMAFNYQFRNESCQYPTKCTFPKANDPFSFNECFRLLSVSFSIGLLVGLVFGVIHLITEAVLKQIEKGKAGKAGYQKI